jgi:diphosphomevalonate decarboxylase
LDICRNAILTRDFAAFAEMIELDSNIMHAVMMTSNPALFYWQPATLTVMNAVGEWRAAGVPAAYTIDAGPNVHVFCPQDQVAGIAAKLRELPGVLNVLTANVGSAAKQV